MQETDGCIDKEHHNYIALQETVHTRLLVNALHPLFGHALMSLLQIANVITVCCREEHNAYFLNE